MMKRDKERERERGSRMKREGERGRRLKREREREGERE